MMSTDLFTIEYLWKITIKRKWLILGVILFSLGGAWMAWKWLPKTYKSTTVITLDKEKVAQDYVKGLSKGGREFDDQFRQLNQQVSELLLSRTALIEIISALKPYGETTDPEAEGHLKRLRHQITTSPVKDGASISISFTHENPLMAQAVTATIAGKLREENLKKRERLAENTTAFLTLELDKAKAELEAREKAIGDFKRSYMGELPQQIEANLRALDRLQSDRVITSETLGRLSDRLTAVEKAVKEYAETGSTAVALPKLERDGEKRLEPGVASLREMEQRLAQLSATYKETYPDIVHLKEEIRRFKAHSSPRKDQLAPEEISNETKAMDTTGGTKNADPYLRELNKQRSEIKAEMASLKEREARIASQLKDLELRVERTPAREQALAILVRDYENMQKNYQSLLDKKLSARIMENLERQEHGEQFRVVDPANLPWMPEPPTQLQVMLVGLAFGCALGMGAAVGLELLKRGFRRPEEAESFLDMPLFAAIPSFESAFIDSPKSLPFPPDVPGVLPGGMHQRLLLTQSKSEQGNGQLTSDRTVARGFSPESNLVAKWRPASVVTEQFRVAATRLVLMGAERKSTVLGVTSALMGEGKSTTAVNLGYVLARDLGKQTLLIDCDLKRPMLHAYAGAASEPGLEKVLQGEKPIEDCLQQLDNVPLWILPAGSTAARRSVELFKMSRLSNILTTLRSRFEYIILDAPPILPLADMNVLATMVDVLALVVRAEATRRDVVQRAIKALKLPNQAGIVLNGLKADWTPYYMQHDYYLRYDAERRV